MAQISPDVPIRAAPAAPRQRYVEAAFGHRLCLSQFGGRLQFRTWNIPANNLRDPVGHVPMNLGNQRDNIAGPLSRHAGSA